MGEHRAARRAAQPRIEALVHHRDHIDDLVRRLVQQPQDLRLALAAVAEHAADQLARIGYRRAVRGVIDPIVAVVEFLQAGHIGGHVPVRRRNHAGRPGHDVIAGEQRAAFDHLIAQVVAGVARGRHRRDRPVGAADPLAVGQDPVGHVVGIESGIGAGAIVNQRQGCAADDLCAGGRLERA